MTGRTERIEPVPIREAIAPALASNQALAREVTVGLTRLKRICARTVTPATEMPDLTSLSDVEKRLAAFRKEGMSNYALAGAAVQQSLKDFNKTIEASGVCEESPPKGTPTKFSQKDCDNAKIFSNNYILLETDIKILNELLNRQYQAVEGVVALEASRCLRPGFSQKLFSAISQDAQSNHKTVGALLKTLTGVGRKTP